MKLANLIHLASIIIPAVLANPFLTLQAVYQPDLKDVLSEGQRVPDVDVEARTPYPHPVCLSNTEGAGLESKTDCGSRPRYHYLAKMILDELTAVNRRFNISWEGIHQSCEMGVTAAGGGVYVWDIEASYLGKQPVKGAINLSCVTEIVHDVVQTLVDGVVQGAEETGSVDGIDDFP